MFQACIEKFQQPQFLIELGVMVAFILVTAFIVRQTLSYLAHSKMKNSGLRILCNTLYGPTFWIIIGYGVLRILGLVIEDCTQLIPQDLFDHVQMLFLASVIALLAFRWRKKWIQHWKKKVNHTEKAKMNQAVVNVIDKVLGIFIVLLFVLSVLYIFEVPLQAILAFGGIGGIAISWAAKDVIANFFGGLMIFINHPFGAGDWIKSPNKNFEGVVEEIGWYMTRLRTFDRRPLYLPNAIITDAIIENPGRMYHRRISNTIGIRYDDMKQLPNIISEIEKYLQSHPQIDGEQNLMVHFMAFGAYSLDMNVNCYTTTIAWKDFRDVQQEILFKVSEIIAKNGAEVAFPTQTLHVEGIQKSEPTSPYQRKIGKSAAVQD